MINEAGSAATPAGGSTETESVFVKTVIAHAKWIVVAWLLLAIMAKLFAPTWKAVALDGDFEYLPSTQTSVAGGQLLDRAFTGTRARSSLVVVFAKESGQWTTADRLLGHDVLRRLYHRLAEVSWRRAERLRSGELKAADAAMPITTQRWYDVAAEALDQALEIDQQFYDLLGDRVPDAEVTEYEPRLAIAFWDRSQLATRIRPDAQTDTALIMSDLEAAVVLRPDIAAKAKPVVERDLNAWKVLLDLYSWQDSVIGGQLKRPKAQIAVLTLSSELAATGNIELLEELQAIIDRCRDYQTEYLHADEIGPSRDLKVRITGSAAIGGQTLLAARSAITYTEWFTVAMILIILAVIYRAPLLVAVPLISIGVAVVTAMALVTMLTRPSLFLEWAGLDLRVYTTSRIFVVVILFGAGTDYCLFLIARLREEAGSHPWEVACTRALSNVSGALLGSAMTTIVGLGMLWFADFGKFHHTGPIIAICLSVGLLVCMTLTPALLRLLGPIVFWPTGITKESEQPKIQLLSTRDLYDGDSTKGKSLLHSGSRFWNFMAIALTRYPIWTLAAGWLLLILPAIGGAVHERSVTYNLAGQLDRSSSSRQGMSLLDRHFGVGELAPISVLALADRDLDEETMAKTRDRLARLLYKTEGVRRVRTMSDPLGDFPPDRDMGLLSSDAWRRRTLQNHRLARLHFIAGEPEYTDRLLRLDVIVHVDPFSRAAADRLGLISSRIQQSFDNTKALTGIQWQLLYTGTTPSIVDLREVTLSDTRRIKLAVIVAVLAVLIMVLRRVVLSIYLIMTVLLSYYATLGLTYYFFRFLDGPEFLGLDWKLPLFLFVILVAVGQDYNVYLVTRIMEERRRLGSLSAVRRAVARTGGIVTACGFVMAATFLSMTSSAWWPMLSGLFGAPVETTGSLQQTTLRGITELGFALGLGVLIDTLYVRTVLVPSFVVLHDRWRKPDGSPMKQTTIALLPVLLAPLFSNLATVGAADHEASFQIETVAGAGGSENNGASGNALAMNVGQPFGVEFGPDDALYVTEVQNHRVMRVDPHSGDLSVVAGCGKKGYSGDGGLASEAQLDEPYEIRFDRDGNLFFVEMQNHLVRRVDAMTGIITTIAGTGVSGYNGNDGVATEIQLNRPHSIALDDRGGLYIADIGNHRIRRVDLSSNSITTIAGDGRKQLPNDQATALGNPVVGPRALMIDGDTLWVALREGHSIWKLSLRDGKWTHVAGSGEKGYSGDGGSAKTATFNGPKGIAVGPDGKVFVVDTENQAIRMIDERSGTISTIAGSGPSGRGMGGDGGPATAARMDRPHGICVGPDGSVFVGDTNNHRVRRVHPIP